MGSEETTSLTESQAPVNVAAAIGQLRALVCILGGGLILVSLALSCFIFKQNRDLGAGNHNREIEIAQFQAQQKPLVAVLNELANYSAGKPELQSIFTRHGLQLTSNNAGGQPAPIGH